MVTTTSHTVGDIVVTAIWETGILGPSEIHVKTIGTSSPYGITYKDFRAITFANMKPAPTPLVLPDGVSGSLEDAGDWIRSQSGGLNGKPLPARFLAMVSLFYVLAVNEGYRDPGACLADYADVRPKRSDEWLTRARNAGYLTRATRGHNGGRSHGELTAKSLEVITCGSSAITPASAA